MDEVASLTDPKFTSLQSLGDYGGPLTDFKGALEDPAKRLASATTGVSLRKVLRWPLDAKETDAILWKIERLKTFISLAL